MPEVSFDPLIDKGPGTGNEEHWSPKFLYVTDHSILKICDHHAMNHKRK
jgi:hypothetical protein